MSAFIHLPALFKLTCGLTFSFVAREPLKFRLHVSEHHIFELFPLEHTQFAGLNAVIRWRRWTGFLAAVARLFPASRVVKLWLASSVQFSGHISLVCPAVSSELRLTSYVASMS